MQSTAETEDAAQNATPTGTDCGVPLPAWKASLRSHALLGRLIDAYGDDRC